MQTPSLRKDPFNIIITGVGGQGTVRAARLRRALVIVFVEQRALILANEKKGLDSLGFEAFHSSCALRQSTRAPESLTSLAYFSLSLVTSSWNSSGVVGEATPPSFSSLS